MTKPDTSPDTQWKSIPGYPDFEVSSKGDVFKISRQRLLKPQRSQTGHRMVTLTTEDKVRKPHRLVRIIGQLFCADFSPEKFPIYIDGDTWNVSASNLKWVPRGQTPRKPYETNGFAGPQHRIEKRTQARVPGTRYAHTRPNKPE